MTDSKMETTSLYDDLWENNKDIAAATLKIDFLKEMQDGHLSAERYVAFTLQDIYYLEQVTEMLGEMKNRKDTPDDIMLFFQTRYESYKKYTQVFLSKFHLKDASSINPDPAITRYLETYREAMKLDPIYFVVAMLPCVRLWPYFAQHLDVPEHSAYSQWKEVNKHGDPAKIYRPLLDKHSDTIDRVRAMSLFKKQMTHECDFFGASVTKVPANAFPKPCRSTVDHRYVFIPFFK